MLGTIGAWRLVYTGKQPLAELRGLPIASELLTRVRVILRRPRGMLEARYSRDAAEI